MQSGTQKEVTLSEPEVASTVQLRVCDDPTEPIAASPKTPAEPNALDASTNTPAEPIVLDASTNTQHSAAESPVAHEPSTAEASCQWACSESTEKPTAGPAERTAGSSDVSKQVDYQAFSESFGKSHQNSDGSFIQTWSNTWERKIKQPFNIAYFMVSTAAIGAVCILWNLPVLWLMACIFGVFTLAAFRAAWSYRVHPNDFAVNLPNWSRRSLRTGALLLPIPFFAVLLAQPLANNELREGQHLFTDGQYKDALVHLNRAAMLNPGLEEAFMELADCYNFTYEHQNSLINAEKALRLDPTDGAAWASKAWALNKQSKFAEALPAALKAVEFLPSSGQANHALADAYFNLGEYASALPPATKHIEIHNTEGSALELRADILDKLGRGEEAALDRAAAAKLDN